MPAIVKAQTIKQAKASYKSRGRPSLTEKEQRQLERSIELEARAEKAREAEKRRAEAAKKKAEQDKKSGKGAAKLGSQRRVDRFGFLASQFHLGAFFGKPKETKVREPCVAEAEDEDFEDGGLDDEELLKALGDGSAGTDSVQQLQQTSNNVLMPPQPARTALSAPTPTKCQNVDAPETSVVVEELDSFWDELGSSTQIARELDNTAVRDMSTSDKKFGSFNSGDFDDLTAEDLDELDPPTQLFSTVSKSKPDAASRPLCAPEDVANMDKTMPPPPRPVKAARAVQKPAIPQIVPSKRAHPFPPNSLKPASHTNAHVAIKTRSTKPQNTIKGPFMPASTLYCSPDLGFTLTQLESFVDDDLQLTQAVPG